MQTLNVVMPGIASGGTASQTVPAKVLDCDTITQVKEKLVEQTWKGTSFSQRPHVDSLHLGQSATVYFNVIFKYFGYFLVAPPFFKNRTCREPVCFVLV